MKEGINVSQKKKKEMSNEMSRILKDCVLLQYITHPAFKELVN